MDNQVSKLRKFVAPEIVFGDGARLLAGQYVQNFSGSRVFLVSDPGIAKTGWLNEITASFDKLNIPYHLFTSVSPNPREDEVMLGTEKYRETHSDIIVALGGGSVMDLAKGVGIVSSNGGHILDFEGIDKITHPVPPLIFIPTTAGSSADVSQFSIITNQREKVKIAIISKTIVPDVALIDPTTTATMNPFLTACTGMDALVHAIEAFVSTASSPITDVHALEAIRIINSNLARAVKEPDNLAVRGEIMRASMEAGLAFSNAILGAVHAMSHSLGGYLDLPHGECNAILLENIIDFNFSSAEDRFLHIARTMNLDLRGMTTSTAKKALMAHIVQLRKQVGINHKLQKAGVGIADIQPLAKKAVADACLITNPRKANQRDIEVLYEEAL